MTWIDTIEADDRMPCCASGMQLGCLPSEVGSIPSQGAKEVRG